MGSLRSIVSELADRGSMRITETEMEALKRSFLEIQDCIKIVVKNPKWRSSGGLAKWNRAATNITSIIRNIEGTGEVQ